MITQERLKQKLNYNPETGTFVWVDANGNFRGHVAGRANSRRYLQITIDGKSYKAHRLAWLYMHGEMPEGFVDHINHDKSDNRITNLRIVSAAESNRNVPRQKNNTSGVTGVSFHKRSGKWRAYIRANQKLINLGEFLEKESAIAARAAANKAYGFHENHGQARHHDAPISH